MGGVGDCWSFLDRQGRPDFLVLRDARFARPQDEEILLP
jgi:hypothetical protein